MNNATRGPRKNLSKRQTQLIDALAAGLEVPEALAQCRVSEAILRKWSKSIAFAQELEYRQQLAGQQSELLIGRFVPVAAGKLIGLLDSEKEETVRKACLDILQLATRQRKIETPQAEKSPKITLSPEMAEKVLNLLAEESK